MRNTFFIILVSTFQVFANGSYAQTKTISLTMNNATIREVLYAIQKQSEFYFLYNSELVDVEKKVNITIEGEKVDEILTRLFDKNDVDFLIKDRYIVLTPVGGNAELLFSQQQRSVSGKVTDSSGQPLPGVTVLKKGTTQGTVTNTDGNYTLTNIPEDATLVFSFVGMQTQEVIVGSQTTISVVMEEETIGIEEVVAIGYGTMKKSDLTGSVVSANIEAFRESPNVSILQSLQGTVPGVQIGQVRQAGEEASISIRGTSTINGNTDPLVVLDGIIYHGNIIDLNPDDIESIDILKDASSKAIYGAQAANGVILITSKGGKVNQKPSISYSFSMATLTPTNDARLLNKDEFLQKVKDINYTTAYLPTDYLQTNPDWDFSQSELYTANLEGIENGTNYDWWDALTSPGHIMDHNLSLRGGTKNTSYFVSGGFSDYEGFKLNDKYQRSSVRINIQTEVTPWLTLGANTFGSFADYSGVYPDVDYITRTSPFVTSKDENGDYIINPFNDYVVNPFLTAEADDKDLRNKISGNFFGIVTVPGIKGLTYRINYSNNLGWTNHFYSNKYDEGLTGVAYKKNASTHDVLLDNIITYDKKINENNSFQVTLVYGWNKTEYEYTEAVGSNYSNLDLSYNSLEHATINLNFYGSRYPILLHG